MSISETHSGGDTGLSDVIALARAFGAAVWRGRGRMSRVLAVAILIGLVIAFSSRPEFAASTKILPYRGAASNNNLSSLAGLAGIRLSQGMADQTITADLYPVIAKTLDFRISVAEAPVRFDRGESPSTLVAYFRTHRTLADRFARWPGALRRRITTFLSGDTTDGAPLSLPGSNGAPLRAFDREYLEIVQDLDNRLIVTYDKKTSVISITGVMPSPYAAADLVQSASERLMRRIIDYEARKAAEQLKFIEEQHRKAQEKYERSQQNLAVFADRNRALVSALAQVERDRLQREYNVAFEVFQQLSLELERARIRKNEDTPVFTVLEEPVVPDRRSSPNRTLILVMSIVIGTLAGMGLLALDWRARRGDAPSA